MGQVRNGWRRGVAVVAIVLGTLGVAACTDSKPPMLQPVAPVPSATADADQ